MREGFVDLRANRDGESADGFWPSFTDIMTVVVMIFMLASTMVILRNSELLAELRAMAQAEKQAKDLAQSVGEENADLESRLAAAQSLADRLRMQLAHATAANRRQAEALSEHERQLSALRIRAAELEKLADERERIVESLSADLAAAERSQAELAAVRDSLADKLELTLAALEQTRHDYAAQGQLLEQVRHQSEASGARISELQTRYDALKVEYDKLFKPARSTKGRHVVEVRYERGESGPSVAFREGDAKPFERVPLSSLHQSLAGLKAKHRDKLYVKIIIPPDSGLSYNEAWNFTKDVLNKYDYYYQK